MYSPPRSPGTIPATTPDTIRRGPRHGTTGEEVEDGAAVEGGEERRRLRTTVVVSRGTVGLLGRKNRELLEMNIFSFLFLFWGLANKKFREKI